MDLGPLATCTLLVSLTCPGCVPITQVRLLEETCHRLFYVSRAAESQ